MYVIHACKKRYSCNKTKLMYTCDILVDKHNSFNVCFEISAIILVSSCNR